MMSGTDALWGAADYAPTAERLEPVASVIAQRAASATPPPATAVDIGAGHGALAALLTDRGYDVVALEPTRRMREVGEALAPAVRWVDAPAETTQFDDGSFDLAVSSFGLMFADPVAGIAETARVLRPGGVMIMTAWSPDGFLHDMTLRMTEVLPQMSEAPHLGWGDSSVARARLDPWFDDIVVDQQSLLWGFASVADGMELYRRGSPAHAMSFAMAGEHRVDLERSLEQHLRQRARPDGTIAEVANYVVISAVRR